MFGLTFRKETEEERWLRKALDGDNTATEWIYRRHVRYLSALCSRYITEDEDINPTCSLYAYNSLILKYRFF